MCVTEKNHNAKFYLFENPLQFLLNKKISFSEYKLLKWANWKVIKINSLFFKQWIFFLKSLKIEQYFKKSK